MKQYRFVCVIGILSLFMSCDAFFGVPAFTPLGVFDAFWDDFRQVYAYMDEHDLSDARFTSLQLTLPDDYAQLVGEGGLYNEALAQANFDSLYEYYTSGITEDSTWDDLYDAFEDLEKKLSDPHFGFVSLNAAWESTPHAYGNAENFHALGNGWEVEILGGSYAYSWGVVKDEVQYSGDTQNTEITHKIGYIYVGQLSDELSGTTRVFGDDSWMGEIDRAISALEEKEISRLIFDVRSNAGGSFYVPKFIAGRFVSETLEGMKLLERNEQGKLLRESDIKVHPRGNTVLADIPTVLISNEITCSGGEFLTLMMKAKPNIVHLGERTSGCAGGIIERDLPDASLVVYTFSKTWELNPDDPEQPRSYFRTGIMPDIEVSANHATTDDELIEEAIRQLNVSDANLDERFRNGQRSFAPSSP